MTDFAAINKASRLLRTLGIQIEPQIVRLSHKGWRDQYKLKVSRKRQLVQFIPKILPYLVTKREQALLVLSVAEVEFKSGPNVGGTPAWIGSAVERVHELNGGKNRKCRASAVRDREVKSTEPGDVGNRVMACTT